MKTSDLFVKVFRQNVDFSDFIFFGIGLIAFKIALTTGTVSLIGHATRLILSWFKFPYFCYVKRVDSAGRKTQPSKRIKALRMSFGSDY